MNNTDNISIDDSPALIPLQAGLNPQLNTPIVVRTVGTISSIAGLFGPDILFTVAANSITISPIGNTITFALASTANTNIFNANTEFQKSGTKVVGARITGWNAPTGTLTRGTYAAYAGQTVSNPPTQAEMQALDDAVKLLSQTVTAALTDIRTHGLFGT